MYCQLLFCFIALTFEYVSTNIRNTYLSIINILTLSSGNSIGTLYNEKYKIHLHYLHI